MCSSEHAAERSVVVGARVLAGPSMTRREVGWREVSSEVQVLRLAHRQQQLTISALCPPHSAPLLPSLYQPLINAAVAPLRGLDTAVADSRWFPAETRKAFAAPDHPSPRRETESSTEQTMGTPKSTLSMDF